MAWAAKEASASSVMALVALPLDLAWDCGKVDTRWRGGLSSAPMKTNSTARPRESGDPGTKKRDAKIGWIPACAGMSGM
jgi:hypothetical protein